MMSRSLKLYLSRPLHHCMRRSTRRGSVRMASTNWYKVPQSIASIEPGGMRSVECEPSGSGDGKPFEVLVIKTKDGQTFAVEPKCPHYGAPLASGVLVDGVASRDSAHGGGPSVICPWHLAEFHLETGDNMNSPSLRGLKTFAMRESDNGMEVADCAENHLGSTSMAGNASYGHDWTRQHLVGADKFVQPHGLAGMTTGGASATPQYADVVVLGSGAAGMATASELRTLGFSGSIVVVDADRHLPYDRIKLSKGAAADEESMQSLTLYSEQWFESSGITLLQRTRAVSCGLHAGASIGERPRGNGYVILESKSESKSESKGEGESRARASIDFGRVVVATGCAANRLPESLVPQERGAHVLRSADDAMAFQSALDGGDVRNLVIVGTSFIGLEVANALSKRIGEQGPTGLDSITLIGQENEPLANVLPEAIGRMIRSIAEEAGVRVLTGVDLQGTTGREAGGSGRIASVQIARKGAGSDHEEEDSIACDLLLMGVGGHPATEFLRAGTGTGTGIGTGAGIGAGSVAMLSENKMDDHGRLLTGEDSRCVVGTDGVVFAAGDAVSAPRHGTTSQSVGIEHWAHAQAEGRWVARSLMKYAARDGLSDDAGAVTRTTSTTTSTSDESIACKPSSMVDDSSNTVPFFWTAGFGGNIRFVGHAPEGSSVHIEGDPVKDRKFAAFFHSDGRICAMAAMGMDPAPAAFGALLREGNESLMPSVEDVVTGKVTAADLVDVLARA